MIVPIWTLNTDRCRPISNERVNTIMADPFSVNDPIRVDTDGRVIDGGHRIAARKRLGLLYVEVVAVGSEPDSIEFRGKA